MAIKGKAPSIAGRGFFRYARLCTGKPAFGASCGLDSGTVMDFKIFNSVLAALLAFAAIVAVIHEFQVRREERALARLLGVSPARDQSASLDEAMRRARLKREASEVSVSDALRMKREQEAKNPDH